MRERKKEGESESERARERERERESEGTRETKRERQAAAAQTVVAGEGGACSLPEVGLACDVLVRKWPGSLKWPPESGPALLSGLLKVAWLPEAVLDFI